MRRRIRKYPGRGCRAQLAEGGAGCSPSDGVDGTHLLPVLGRNSDTNLGATATGIGSCLQQRERKQLPTCDALVIKD